METVNETPVVQHKHMYRRLVSKPHTFTTSGQKQTQ